MAALLKDLYHQNYIENVSNNISLVYSDFKQDDFINSIFCSDWKNKELKQRMRHISKTLGIFLPQEYKKAVEILMRSYNNRQTNIGNRKDKLGLENMIFQDFVEVYGLYEFKTSMKAMECFTQNSSSEFAIRQFILKYEDATMEQLKVWTKSKSEHTRRLASEGCRSRLPWAIALSKYKKDPSKVIEILELLKDDKSKYVQKSVANNLNDISKDNIDIVKNLAKSWIGQSKDLDWIVKHGCRTLLKDGDIDILNLFGFTPPDEVSIQDIKVSKKVSMGRELSFEFNLISGEALGKLRVEYAITFVRLNGRSNRKVFKICEGNYTDSFLMIDKQYSFKKISTRKYYSGEHLVEFIVNGVSLSKYKFRLVDDETT